MLWSVHIALYGGSKVVNERPVSGITYAQGHGRDFANDILVRSNFRWSGRAAVRLR
jgi:hypothetical protein